jgi:hypothetical protein
MSISIIYEIKFKKKKSLTKFFNIEKKRLVGAKQMISFLFSQKDSTQ